MSKFSKKYILGESIKYILDFIKKSQKRKRDQPQRKGDVISELDKRGLLKPQHRAGMHKAIETEQIKSKAGGRDRRIAERRGSRDALYGMDVDRK